MSQKYPCFDYLLSLEHCLRAQAKGLPFQTVHVEDFMAVIFSSGDHILLTPLSEVTEILKVTLLAPLPGVKAWLRGMATTRGELFAVTDLNGLLNERLSKITAQSRILVIDFRQEYSGILVDRVLGLQRIPLSKTKETMKEKLAYEPFLLGSFANENVELPIISCQRLIQHPCFRDVGLRVV